MTAHPTPAGKAPDRPPSVQGGIIAAAVFKFCGEKVDVVGAGRTDAGVHAIAQVAHVDLPKDLEPFRVMQGINYYLFNSPGTECASVNRIAILNAEAVSG